MNLQAAHAAQDSVGHAKAAARKRCPPRIPALSGRWNDARVSEHFRTGSSASFDLMPTQSWKLQSAPILCGKLYRTRTEESTADSRIVLRRRQ